MAPPKNPSKHQPAKDFAKRPKAKVGKRAPAKLNATDTSFKTSSVTVRSQTTSLDKNVKKTDVKSSLVARMELQSSRGNALSTLQASLRHHAPAVRCSGLKGMRDAVQSLACKGVTLNKDDAEVYNLGISILESNLPSLLPNMCRCWLDEDGDVRDLAIQLFGDIISNLTVQSKVLVDGEASNHLACLVPFVPFLCAYASSALNSLDRSIRKDGALLVGMMASCSSYPTFSLLKEEGTIDTGSALLRNEVGKHVDLFLPSLERLLSSISFGSRSKAKTGTKNEKKRKRDDKSASSTSDTASSFKTLGAADATILSLALLLKASLAENNLNATAGKDSPVGSALMPSLRVTGECSFLRGGSAYVNSMLLFRGIERQAGSAESVIKPISSIFDLPLMPVDDIVGSATSSATDEITPTVPSSQQHDPNLEKAQILSTLVETLRIKFVELTQVGRASNTDRKGIMMPVSDLDTLDVLVKALKFANHRGQFLREFMDQCQLHIESNSSTNKRQKKSISKRTNKAQDVGACIEAYQATISKMVCLILNNFPICSLDGKASTTRYDLTNAELCASLAELGADNIGPGKISSPWIDAVFSYILPRLSPDEKSTNSAVEDRDACAIIAVLLQIVRKLLLPTSAGGSDLVYLLKSKSKRWELLQVLCNVFFPYKMLQGMKDIESLTNEGQGLWLRKIALTSAGRAAAGLLTSLISLLGDKNAKLDEKSVLLIMQMGSVLPVYLLSWQHEYPMETGKILAAMLSMARSASCDGNSSNSWNNSLAKLCTDYQQSIGVMFNSFKTGQIQSNGKPMIGSIFELSPEPVQKLTIGLICMLGSPSETTINSLSKICSRALSPLSFTERVVATDMIEYIFETMHALRKSMSVSVYLSFLINASGIEKFVLVDEPTQDSLFVCDDSIHLLCRFLACLRDDVPSRVLPMIRPTLEKWLTSNINASKQIIRTRAVLSILASFTWDEVYPQIGCEGDTYITSKFLQFDDEFEHLLSEAILGMFEMVPSINTTESHEDGNAISARLLGPVTFILCFRDGALSNYLQAISRKVSVSENDLTNVEIHMKVLLTALKSKDPASVSSLIRRRADLQNDLLSLVESIAKNVEKSHLVSLSEKLSYEANHIINMASS